MTWGCQVGGFHLRLTTPCHLREPADAILIVLLSGDPFFIYTRVIETYIDGKVVSSSAK